MVLIRNIVLLSCCVTLLLSCSETKKKKEPLSGKTIYEHNCAICHGGDGKLGSGGAKDLSVSILTKEERIAIIKNGGKGMTPFSGVLLDEEIVAVSDFLESLKND